MDKKKFSKLQKKWYRKLEKSGFYDLENPDYQDGLLNDTLTSRGSIDPRRVSWEAREEYYRLATHFLHDYEFGNSIERVIWEYHSNGLSERDIATILKKVKRKGYSYPVVWRIIHRLEQEMKRMYGVTK